MPRVRTWREKKQEIGAFAGGTTIYLKHFPIHQLRSSGAQKPEKRGLIEFFRLLYESPEGQRNFRR